MPRESALSALVVGQEPDLLAQLGRALERAGFDGASFQADPETASEAHQREQQPLVLVEVQSPGLQAEDFCLRLRNQPGGDHCVLLAVTRVPDLAAALLKAGADDLVLLPIRDEALELQLLAAGKRIREREARRQPAAAGRSADEVLRDVIRHLPDYIVTADRHARLVFTSQGGAGQQEELLGSLISEHLAPEHVATYEAAVARARETRQVQSYEVVVYGRTYAVRLIPVFHEDQYLGATMVATDVTPLKRAQAERERLLAEAETALREARAALQLRHEFLSVASHELRTPLTSLRTALEAMALTADEGQPLGEPARRLLDICQRQAARLCSLVDDLLDTSRLQRGGLELHREDMDLTPLVRDVVARFESDLAHAGCTLVLSLPASLGGHWDRSRLDQVVSNLLSNAIKFAPRTPIELEVADRDGWACVQLRDRGIGIPRDRLKQIFEPFERAVSSEHYGGLGIGLYIVKRIVEAHGGWVRAESVLGQGSTFTVALPRGLEDHA